MDKIEVTQDLTWRERYDRYGVSGRKTVRDPKASMVKISDTIINARKIPEITEGDVSKFFKFIKKTDSCWIWEGCLSGNKTHKYGDFYFGGRMYRAHRVSYTIANGPIPNGLVIDHLCKNTLCVNPQHLDAVTSGENTRRGLSYPTHCKRGHELSGDNIRAEGGNRRCLACQRVRTAKWRAKKNG